jgi:membrane fusion protein, heavy metal efflux system
MTGERRVNLSPAAAAAAFVMVLLVGAGGTYLIMRGDASDASETMSRAASRAAGAAPTPSASGPASLSAGQATSAPLRDVVVTLAPEAVARAGIEISQATTIARADRVPFPGVVEPNAYRQVAVTPLVGGRVVRTSAQLGDRVRRGQALAQVFSPELAAARTKYLAAKAMLDAHDRELQRTQKLMEIGAASRQELERIHAEHAAQTAEVESARSRLRLLGAAGEATAPKGDQDATITVPAPIEGVVTERMANVGLNVDPTTKLFSIVDLSNVWIVADVYEKDLHRIREGARATVTTTAYPDLSVEGRVSYIDPQLNSATRTAKVRVEVPNPRGQLRLGMYTDVTIESGGAMPVLSVPKASIQNVADRQVVYVPIPQEPAKFIEREVRLGRPSGDVVEVVSGLNSGDAVVSKGSFFLRAEAERLGLRSAPVVATGDLQSRTAAVQTAKIAVTEKGYEPDRISLRAGVPARLTIVRTTDKTCGKEIVFPSLNIERALPLNEPVVIGFTPAKTGEVAFACGMNMLQGVVVVQ